MAKKTILLTVILCVVFPVFAISVNDLRIIASDNTFLGTLEDNEYSSNSIYNKYGKYGSKYNSNCILNKYDKYGSDYDKYLRIGKR
jgi:hypothetical protein